MSTHDIHIVENLIILDKLDQPASSVVNYGSMKYFLLKKWCIPPIIQANYTNILG